LNQTASVWSRNFLVFSAVGAVIQLPSVLFSAAVGTPGSFVAGSVLFQVVSIVVGALLLVLLATLSEAVLVYAAFQDMRGLPVNLRESVLVCLRRFLPIIGLALAVSVLVILGIILLIVPGLILATVWFVATPACVVEQLGPSDSMRRSFQLTKGHRWKIFGLMLLVGVVSGVISTTMDAALAAIGGSVLVFVGELIWNGIWGAFYAILVVVTYRDLRVAKEGTDTHQIAAVFE
jgi:hypothetical protein